MKKILAFILCITMLIPCAMFNTFAQDSNTVESGKVLYNQQLGDATKGKTLEELNLTNLTDSNGTTEIDTETGFISSKMKNSSQSKVIGLPDVLEGDTYTVEVVFRFKKNLNDAAYDSAYFWIGFDLDNYSTSSYGEERVGLKRIGSTEANNIKFENGIGTLSDVEAGWTFDKDNEDKGEWVTMTVAVKDDKLSKLTLSCNGNVWTSTDVVDDYVNTEWGSSTLYIHNRQAGFDISSIRVVEGVDFANVTNAGVQPGTDGKSARLVAEIADSKFAAAGFKVSLSYTNATTNKNVTTQVNDKKANYAYTSLQADTDRGIEQITPQDGYYLIAIVIEDIPEYVNALKITFTPYATTADGDTYTGQVYVYDVAAQTVNVQ